MVCDKNQFKTWNLTLWAMTEHFVNLHQNTPIFTLLMSTQKCGVTKSRNKTRYSWGCYILKLPHTLHHVPLCCPTIYKCFLCFTHYYLQVHTHVHWLKNLTDGSSQHFLNKNDKDPGEEQRKRTKTKSLSLDPRKTYLSMRKKRQGNQAGRQPAWTVINEQVSHD